MQQENCLPVRNGPWVIFCDDDHVYLRFCVWFLDFSRPIQAPEDLYDRLVFSMIFMDNFNNIFY